jgi:hypothetical protein
MVSECYSGDDSDSENRAIERLGEAAYTVNVSRHLPVLFDCLSLVLVAHNNPLHD